MKQRVKAPEISTLMVMIRKWNAEWCVSGIQLIKVNMRGWCV